jgi:hypothetical protein
VSTRVPGAAILVMASARATLSAGTARLTLAVTEGPAPRTWKYNLADGTSHRAACGRIAGPDGRLGALRSAAAICAAGYQPGTPERGLLEQLAAAT